MWILLRLYILSKKMLGCVLKNTIKYFFHVTVNHIFTRNTNSFVLASGGRESLPNAPSAVETP